jgi:hypothetical protein
MLKTAEGLVRSAGGDPLYPPCAAAMHDVWAQATRLHWAELCLQSGLRPASETHPISPVHRKRFLEALEARARVAAA